MRAVAASLLLAAAIGSCMPNDELLLRPSPVELSVAPFVRVALLVDVARPGFSGTGGLRVIDPAIGELASFPEGTLVTALARGSMVEVGGVARAMVILAPGEPAGAVVLNGRGYAGTIELTRAADGVLVVNKLTLEEYLAGVVAAEMGNRSAEEMAALEAQAVASRTYAIRQMMNGADRDRDYDLLATVDHQVYRGQDGRATLAADAVAATRGEVLTWGGQPIDAFFSSTCGGRSEAGRDVFVGADRTYLQSAPDVGPDGVAWCAISPRYRWRERWSGAEMAGALRASLASEGLPTGRATDLREVRVLNRTGSGRVSELELVGSGGRTRVSGSAIRRVLAPSRGELLPSADFTVRIARSGGRIEGVEIEGRGFGHGVGMCQWGAIGRARGGQDYRTILMSYFPGTTLERMY